MGQHLVECCGTAHNIDWDIIEACRSIEKLITIDMINIKELILQSKTRDGYQGRELTLNKLFKYKKFDV